MLSDDNTQTYSQPQDLQKIFLVPYMTSERAKRAENGAASESVGRLLQNTRQANATTADDKMGQVTSDLQNSRHLHKSRVTDVLRESARFCGLRRFLKRNEKQKRQIRVRVGAEPAGGRV